MSGKDTHNITIFDKITDHMKHFRFCLLLFLPLALACSRKAYDVSDGFNTDLTLFENEISVPVGSVGPSPWA